MIVNIYYESANFHHHDLVSNYFYRIYCLLKLSTANGPIGSLMETAAILVRVVLELGQEVVTTRLHQTGVPIAMDQQRNPKRVIQMLAVSYKYHLTSSYNLPHHVTLYITFSFLILQQLQLLPLLPPQHLQVLPPPQPQPPRQLLQLPPQHLQVLPPPQPQPPQLP